MRPSLKTKLYLELFFRNAWRLGFNPKVRNYLRYRMTPFRTRIDPLRAGPVFMTLSLTRRCNLGCRFCVVGDVVNKRGVWGYEATLDDVRRLLRHPVAQRCLYVMLTGGEPLLHEEVLRIVRIVKGHGHLAGLNTNGHRLDKLVEPLRDAGLDMLNISVYETNRDLLGEVVPAASRLFSTKLVKIIGRDDVLHPQGIEDTLQLARGSNCRRVFFNNVLPHVDGLALLPEIPDMPLPSGRERQPIGERERVEYARIRSDLSRRYRDVSIHWPAPVLDFVDSSHKRCRAPWYLLVVDAQGRMGFCCAHPACTGPSLFDIPAGQVLNEWRWLSTRRSLLAEDDEFPAGCRGCFVLDDSWWHGV